MNVYVNCDEIQWKTGETPDAGAVDTLANLQKAYGLIRKDTFGRDGITNDKNVKLDAIVGIQNVREGNEVTDFRDNAAMSGTDTMLIGQKTDGSATYAAELDVMGHEFNHGVVNGMSTLLQGVYSDNNARQRSSQLAMGEGLADIFGEFVEDYSDDGKYNGSCSWTNPVRSMNNRTDILNHNGILQAKDFQDGTTDCHQGASLIPILLI